MKKLIPRKLVLPEMKHIIFIVLLTTISGEDPQPHNTILETPISSTTAETPLFPTTIESPPVEYIIEEAPRKEGAGASKQYRIQDNLGNYAFGYNEEHTSGSTFRREQSDTNGNKIGSYGIKDSDGRIRVVHYVADSSGFRAKVHTNEPGVNKKKNPADVTVSEADDTTYEIAAEAPPPALTYTLTLPGLKFPSVVFQYDIPGYSTSKIAQL